MFVYSPGGEFSGIPELVRPGDEMIFSGVDSEIDTSSEVVCSSLDNFMQNSQFGECPSQHKFNPPVQDKEMEHLRHKDFSGETKKKLRWVLKMYHD